MKRRPKPEMQTKRQSQDHDAGYARPPRTHQFKPGQSGNPKGRPKGVKNEVTILNELLQRKIAIREGGRTRKITILEAILLRFTEDSLKGNVKSAAFVLNRHSVLASGDPQRVDVNDDDRAILEAFAQRLIAQRTDERL